MGGMGGGGMGMGGGQQGGGDGEAAMYALNSKVWELRPLPQLLQNYVATCCQYMTDMRSRFNRSQELDDTVFAATKERIEAFVSAQEPISAAESGRRDIRLHDGKFYLEVLDTTENTDSIRQRHEENVQEKKSQDASRRAEREARMARKMQKGKGKGKGGKGMNRGKNQNNKGGGGNGNFGGYQQQQQRY